MRDLTIKDLGQIENENAFYATMGKLAGQLQIELNDVNTKFTDEDKWIVHYYITVNAFQANDIWLELEDNRLIINTHHIKFNDNKGLSSEDADFRCYSAESYPINNNNSVRHEMAAHIAAILQSSKMDLDKNDIYDNAIKILNEPSRIKFKP